MGTELPLEDPWKLAHEENELGALYTPLKMGPLLESVRGF